MCNTSKKSSGKLPLNFEIILKVFFLKKWNKNVFFCFRSKKILGLCHSQTIFSKQLKEIGKKYFWGASWDNKWKTQEVWSSLGTPLRWPIPGGTDSPSPPVQVGLKESPHHMSIVYLMKGSVHGSEKTQLLPLEPRTSAICPFHCCWIPPKAITDRTTFVKLALLSLKQLLWKSLHVLLNEMC